MTTRLIRITQVEHIPDFLLSTLTSFYVTPFPAPGFLLPKGASPQCRQSCDMADPSEILNVITAQVAAIIYPNGTGSASITDTAVNVYAGWPLHSTLDTDILAGTSHVSIFPMDEEQKMATALGRPYRLVTSGDPSIVATVSDTSVTLSGTVSIPQNVYFLVDGTGYHYFIPTRMP